MNWDIGCSYESIIVRRLSHALQSSHMREREREEKEGERKGGEGKRQRNEGRKKGRREEEKMLMMKFLKTSQNLKILFPLPHL